MSENRQPPLRSLRNRILVDISEFAMAPSRTGIQRVVQQIILAWPEPAALRLVMVDDAARMRYLPDDYLRLMRAFFHGATGDDAPRHALEMAVGMASEPVPVDEILAHRAILVPELFYRGGRITFYLGLLERAPDFVFALAHDWFLWLHPEWREQGVANWTAEYLDFARKVRHMAFNSEATRQDYLARITRDTRPTGPAVTLGADGMGVAEPDFDPARRGFLFCGTIEPRKNTGPLLDAFTQLWKEDVPAELILAGRVATTDPSIIGHLDRLRATEPRFCFVDSPDDEAMRRLIRGSRATVYPCLAEGFGIPPLESLALGVPVIVADAVPSVGCIDAYGQIRLPDPNASAIANAVLAMMNDETARALTDEIAGMALPRWAAAADTLARWIAIATA